MAASLRLPLCALQLHTGSKLWQILLARSSTRALLIFLSMFLIHDALLGAKEFHAVVIFALADTV
jgi:hypothetical protein